MTIYKKLKKINIKIFLNMYIIFIFAFEMLKIVNFRRKTNFHAKRSY